MAYYPQYSGYQPYYQGQPNIINTTPITNVQPQQNGNFIVRPVASIEEAKAVPTDFTGAMTILTDLSHGAIYTKTLNYQDGTAIFNCYRLANSPVMPQATATIKEDYVPRAEFNALKDELQRLSERMNGYVATANDTDRAIASNGRKRRESHPDDSGNVPE